MTGLLEQALRRVQSLSSDEQDAIAAQILDSLDDEAGWNERLRSGTSRIGDLSGEALEEHHRGETQPLDELIR